MATVETSKLLEVAARIREMREIFGFTEAKMAEKTEVTLEDYVKYESGELDFPFTFIHKCTLAFGVGVSDLLEGKSANLLSYTVTRNGEGQETAKEDGITIKNLAPKFRKKIAEPYFVRYEYNALLQDKPIHLTKHSGQEFDYIVSGELKIQVGDHIEYLKEGDSIYYNSSTPLGMIAVGGKDCVFSYLKIAGCSTPSNCAASFACERCTLSRNSVNLFATIIGFLSILSFASISQFQCSLVDLRRMF